MSEYNPSCPETLKSFARAEIKKYLDSLSDKHPCNLYDIVLSQVEEPLFQQVMDYCNANQTRAARLLGMSRTTLNKKLKIYKIINDTNH